MKTRQSLSLLLALLLFCFTLSPAAAEEFAKPLVCGDFEYTLLPDGTAEIVLYHTLDANITLPAELDGHPVSSVGALGLNLAHRFGGLDSGIYLSIDDINLLAQDSSLVAQHPDRSEDIRATWVEKILTEDTREMMIRFLARQYAWEQGWKVISDTNASGEPRDATQYQAKAAADYQARIQALQIELAEKQAAIDDPATAENKVKAYQRQAENLQAELAELEARIEKLYSSVILTDSDAKARWTEIGGITSSPEDKEVLLQTWQTAYESLAWDIKVPENYNNGKAFIHSSEGLGFGASDCNFFDRLLQRLQTIPAAPENGRSNYILLDQIPRVIVVPPLPHSIVISEGIAHIGNNAFSNLFGSSRELTSVTIPASVTSIGEDAFYGCRDLTVTVTSGSYGEQYCRDNGIPFVYAEPQN